MDIDKVIKELELTAGELYVMVDTEKADIEKLNTLADRLDDLGFALYKLKNK